MAWFPRRNKFRRVSSDRARPIPPQPSEPALPPGKRPARYLLTAFFLIAGAAILSFPTSGPRLKAGDVAANEYRARVAFKILDDESTGRDQDEAEARCPRVFRENRGHMDRLPGELERFFRSVDSARRVGDLAAGAQSRWGIASDKLPLLRQGLDRKWLQASQESIKASVKRAADLGIMDSSERRKELASGRDEIVVQSDLETPLVPNKDRGQEFRRSVSATLEYPAAVREFLADELTPVLQGQPQSFRDIFLDLLTHCATPTLSGDREATARVVAAAREGVGVRYDSIAKDSVLVAAGGRVTTETMNKIEAEQKEYDASVAQGEQRDARAKEFRRRFVGAAGITALFFIGFVLLAHCARYLPSETLASNTRLAGLYVLFLLPLAATRLLEQFGVSLQWSPVTLAAMVFAVTLGAAGAFGALFLLSLLTGIAVDGGVLLMAPLLLGGAVAIFRTLRLKRRTHVFEAGLSAGLMQLAGVWAMWAIHLPRASVAPQAPAGESLAALGSGVLAGAVMTAALPYVEKFFDVATDLRLLEWTDQNQPLLRKLAMEAPGTYHHSALVSNMAAEAAAEIGANALLARVGGYLHDVGKINRPEYFVENAGGQQNRHEKLSPALSALILTAHAKDGVELAARYGVPSPIRRMIAEHHGTCVIEFFYNKALQEAERSGAVVKEEMFRYRGRRPRSPEAAIVMLADSVESAARSMDAISSSGIERLVHEIVERRLRDGQLDESGMTLTDIRIVEKSLVRSLTAISHPRIRYPASRS